MTPTKYRRHLRRFKIAIAITVISMLSMFLYVGFASGDWVAALAMSALLFSFGFGFPLIFLAAEVELEDIRNG